MPPKNASKSNFIMKIYLVNEAFLNHPMRLRSKLDFSPSDFGSPAPLTSLFRPYIPVKPHIATPSVKKNSALKSRVLLNLFPYVVYLVEILPLLFNDRFLSGKTFDSNLFSLVDNVYNTIQDLRDALLSREVEGVLIDAYTAGSSGSLFVKPGIRAVEVLRYPRSYGLVLSGRMANLADEARVYLASNQNKILKLVESNTQKMKVVNFKKY